MNNLHQQIATLTPEQRTLFEQRLKQRGIQLESLPTATTVNSIPKRDREDNLPLSFSQQRLWFIQQLDPESSAYNVPSALRLQGNLNIVALQQTLTQLVERHEILRSRFILNAEKQPIQVIDPAKFVHIPIVDLSQDQREHPTCEISIPSADFAGEKRLQNQRTLPLCASGEARATPVPLAQMKCSQIKQCDRSFKQRHYCRSI
jgi:hypothetical protein